MRPAYDSSKEDLYQVAGDPQHGMSSTVNFLAGAKAHPQVRYSGKYGTWVLEADVHQVGSETSVLLICPLCRNNLRVTSDRKAIDWDPERGLSVEAFGCTWELPEANERKMEFGLGLCTWKVVIDRNVARDA